MSKRYREAVFHSSVLIPWWVVDDKEEKVEKALAWLEHDRKGYYFNEPDEVCHRDNLLQKMVVKSVIKKSSEDAGKTKIVGIRCYWWEDC
jgi:hypothetical protein